MSDDEACLRRQLILICRLAYERGYLCGTEGNISALLPDRTLLSTASATCKGLIEETDLVLTDLEGNLLSASSGRKISTELRLHLVAYKARADIKAIVHAHPTTAVGFTVSDIPLTESVLPEVVCTLGSIPTAPYATPSTDEVPESIKDYVQFHDAILLDHHGAITFGADLFDAFFKMETVEHFAQTMLVARTLGSPRSLSGAQVDKLMSIRGVYGLKRPVKLYS